MKLTMHGAGCEVGRSCLEVSHNGKRFLLDGGIKIRHEGNEYPTKIKNIDKVQAFFLSHAHMDHSGALPMLWHYGLKCPIITTPCTKDITRILLKDSWKIDRIEGREEIYGRSVIKEVLDNMHLQRAGNVAGIKYKLLQTGHIPSSQAVYLDLDGLTVLYSGDVNGTSTRLLDGVTKYPHADVLILESTYGNRNHTPREKTEREFIDTIKETAARGGTSLIAAFAVGRAQEIMILLKEANLRVPIYLDGMSKKVLQVFLKHEYELRNNDLSKAANKVEPVNGWRMRKRITDKPAVIIATAGMLDGGPILGYLKSLYKDPKHSVLMTGYQAEESNGRLLLNEGKVKIDEKEYEVKTTVKHFDLSAHASMDDLHQIIDSVKPKHLILNHGDSEPERALAEYAEKKGIKAHMPKTGESITIE